jgi:predicted Zn-dependent protease
VQLEPEQDVYWHTKGEVLEELHRHNEALAAFLEAKRLDPNDSSNVISVAKMMFHVGEHDGAERLLRGLVRRGITTPEVLANLGGILLASGRSRRALPVFEEASRLFPHDAFVWLKLAQCRLVLGETMAALADIERAKAFAIDDLDGGRMFCRILFRLNRHEEACKTLPSDVIAHGIFHELTERTSQPLPTDELIAIFRELQSRVDGDAWAAAFRGGVWEYLGFVAAQFKEASADGLLAISDVLAELSATMPALTGAKTLLDVMVRYKKSGDQRILLELPLEQRTLLESETA